MEKIVVENKSLEIPERVDTFNQLQVLAEIRTQMLKTKESLVMDFTKNRFLSIPFIKGLALVAEDAQSASKSLVILNAGEKIKKQIGIYSDLDLFTVRRVFSKPEWPSHGVNADF